MATQIFKAESFVLQDETEVEVKPLTINRLRPFMVEINKLGKLEDDDDAVDVLFDAAQIAISKARPDLVGQTDDNATQKKAKREKLEDILDMPTLHKILEVAGGVKLNDPNLTTAV